MHVVCAAPKSWSKYTTDAESNMLRHNNHFFGKLKVGFGLFSIFLGQNEKINVFEKELPTDLQNIPPTVCVGFILTIFWGRS